VPHFNEPLSLPPELSWNLKTDRRSDQKSLDTKNSFIYIQLNRISYAYLFSAKFEAAQDKVFKILFGNRKEA